MATCQNEVFSPRSITLETSWIALICWLALGLLIYLSATPPTQPTIYPDEICNLSWARFLSGTGPHYDMSMGGACHLVYPALLAPLYWLDPDPAELYRGIFLINCFLVAACFPLAVRLAIRHFGVEGWQAGLIGVVVMAYPTLTLFNHHAWPESALYPLVLVAFLSYCRWVEQPDWRRFIILGLVSLLLYLTHPKMLIFPMAWVTLIGAGLLFNRGFQLYRARALLWIMSMFLAIFIIHMLIAQFVASIRQSSLIELIRTVGKLADLNLVDLTAKVSGQLFYAAVVTGGLIWVSLAVGVGSLLHACRHGVASIPELEKKNLFVPVMVLLMALETAIFLSSSMRFDTLFYGRHIDTLLPAALVAALALFFRQRIPIRTAWMAIGLILACLALLAVTLPAPPWSGFSWIHVQGAELLMKQLFAIDSRGVLLLAIALLLLGTALIVFGASRDRRRWIGLLPLITALSLAQATSRPVSVPVSRFFPDRISDALNSREECLISWDENITGGALRQFFRIQYHFPRCEIELSPHFSCAEADRFVISQEPWADCPTARSAVPLPPDLLLYHTRW